ncbi:MAG: hypothetical protein NVV59_17660 [Chitinophagaceae bacterium]|nr:hypothetical protein [Chitinophagaceae bacterium]
METLKEERGWMLRVPVAFAKMGQEVGVGVEELLQELVSALSVYAHLAPKDGSRPAAAMVLFQQWLQQRNAVEEQLRTLHHLCVLEMLSLAQSPLSRAQRNEAGHDLITRWYGAASRYVVGDKALQEDDELHHIHLCLTPDVLMLQRLFHFGIEEFLLFYMQSLSATAGADVAEENRQLALHFFVVTEDREQ